MSLIEFIILATIIGVMVYIVTTYVPMPQPIRTIIVAACLVLLLILVRGVGMDMALPRVR